MRRIALAMLAASLLCACGQKGSLYMPGEERTAVSTADAAAGDAAPATPVATDADADRDNAARTNRNN